MTGRCLSPLSFSVGDSYECAENCVVDTLNTLVRRGNFRGYDYDCWSKSYLCLYDKGTLDGGNDGGFDGGTIWNKKYRGRSDGPGGGAGEVSGAAEGAVAVLAAAILRAGTATATGQ